MVSAGWLRDVLALALGLFTGVLSGAFGIGGAVISTPGIRLLGATAKQAIASTLPSVLPSSIAGTMRFRYSDLVDWRTIAFVAPPGMVASIGGALLVDVLPGNGHPLQIITAGLIAYSAIRMLAQPAPPPRTTEEGRPRRGPLIAIGALAGGLSGLLGIGGGVLMVPAFTQWAKLGLKQSIATSLACVGIFAIPGTITHTVLGNIDWGFAIPLSIGVVPGARIGSAITMRTSDQRLRVAVSVLLIIVAVVFGVAETIALFT